MAVEMAQYPFEGYKLYIVFHKKEKRRIAILAHSDGHRRTTSYARYLMSVHLGRELDISEQVDHINNDKTDDRLENLQILSQIDNIRKSAKHKTYVPLVCPICGCSFSLDRRMIHNDHPTCSRSCGGKQSHVTKKLNMARSSPRVPTDK